MTGGTPLQGLVLAVHPYRKGFGWCLFEGPLAPVDWGIVEAKKNRNARCLERVGRILERYEPAILVLEQFDRRPAKRAARVKKLCRAIVHLAGNHGIELAVYSRAAVRTAFATIGATTRHEIAQIIALHVTALRRHLPPHPRKAWEGEDHRQCLFDAAALGLTHFAVSGNPLSFSSKG